MRRIGAAPIRDFIGPSIRFGIRFGVALGIVALAIGGPGRPAVAQTSPAISAEQELADKYAPVVVVRKQSKECGDGEPYIPTTVEAALGRPDVVLRDASGAAVVEAPTAADLYQRGPDFYVDMPGNPLEPGCTYETWGREAETPVAVYGRVTTDPDHPDQLVVQYWLYWVFNDWNDKHESDWEMVQLVFDVDSAETALQTDPVQVVYAQHEGAQLADWGDDDLRLVDDRPVVYSGQGSHASYYSQNRWFGKSAATGFGCDDTTSPGTRLDPTVVLLPEEVSGPDDPFAWLSFEGHWGQKEPSYNNGPTGPSTKEQWTSPVTWMEDEGRDAAIALPTAGGAATDMFCRLSSAGSLLFLRFLQEPLLVVGALVALVAVLVVIVRMTTWSPGDPEPVILRRAGGQMLRAAVKLVRHYWRLFCGIGLLTLLAGILALGVQHLVFELTPFGTASDVVDEGSSWAGALALAAGALVTVPATALVYVGCSRALRALAEGRRPEPWRILRSTLRRPAGLFVILVLAAVIGAGIGTLVLIPVAVYLLARWATAAPAVAWEELDTGQALRRSAQLSRRHRVRTALLTVVALALAWALGPFIGMTILLVTDIPLRTANVVSGAIGVLTVPIAAVIVNLLYVDLRLRMEPDWRVDAEPLPSLGGPEPAPDGSGRE